MPEFVRACAVDAVADGSAIRVVLDGIPVAKVRSFEDGLLSLLRGKNADILTSIRDSRDLSDDTAAKLKAVVEAYAKTFA